MAENDIDNLKEEEQEEQEDDSDSETKKPMDIDDGTVSWQVFLNQGAFPGRFY